LQHCADGCRQQAGIMILSQQAVGG
jgi:hypothetical protein